MISAQRRPAAFIDRDGTLISEREYLADPDGVSLVPGAVEALRRLARAGYACVVITNQSGIARGLYGEDEYRAVRDRIAELLAAERISLDAVYHCPHHPDFTGPCACRKPGTALFERAIEELGIDPAASAFIGDRLKDVLPASKLGGRAFLVRTGFGADHAKNAPADVEIVEDLPAAVDRLLTDAG